MALPVAHVPILPLMAGAWSLDMTTWSEDGQASRAPGLRSRKEVVADGRSLREQMEVPFRVAATRS